jgi:GntR family transcriptional regulator, arabinose operon transcriptional repressor
MNNENSIKMKYMTIYDHYKTLITNEVLKPGEKLPTEKEIGESFNVSRITITKALNMLSGEGYIYRIQGGGTYVKESDPLINDNKVEFISLITSFKPKGREIELIQGIENHLQQAGYLLSVNNSNDDPDIEKQLVLNMKNKAKGIILYTARSNRNIDVFYDLFKEQYPIIYVDKYPFNVPCSYVVSDNYDGGYKIGKLLTEKGHSRIALIFHEITDFTSELGRFDGFMKAIGDNNIPMGNIKLIPIRGSEMNQNIQRLLKQLLNEKDDSQRITAVFACNDVVAYSLINYINDNNFTLPANFIIAGFDDIYDKPQNIPFITVHQNLYNIGETAAKLVLGQINRETFFNEHHVIPVELVENYNLR